MQSERTNEQPKPSHFTSVVKGPNKGFSVALLSPNDPPFVIGSFDLTQGEAQGVEHMIGETMERYWEKRRLWGEELQASLREGAQ